MRTAAFLLLTVTLPFGCSSSTPNVQQEEVEITGYNFAKYSARGFLITPEPSSGEYQSIGMLNVTAWPRLEEVAPGDVDNDGYKDKEWRVTEEVSSSEVIEFSISGLRSSGPMLWSTSRFSPLPRS